MRIKPIVRAHSRSVHTFPNRGMQLAVGAVRDSYLATVEPTFDSQHGRVGELYDFVSKRTKEDGSFDGAPTDFAELLDKLVARAARTSARATRTMRTARSTHNSHRVRHDPIQPAPARPQAQV